MVEAIKIHHQRTLWAGVDEPCPRLRYWSCIVLAAAQNLPLSTASSGYSFLGRDDRRNLNIVFDSRGNPPQCPEKSNGHIAQQLGNGTKFGSDEVFGSDSSIAGNVLSKPA